MTNEELATYIRHGLFAERDTVKQAFDFAFELINRMSDSEKTAATTALMVVVNTISKQILTNEGKAV
jgi:hypothetical protein